MGQCWFISGRRVSHFGPRDGRFSPILAIFRAPRRPISVKLGRLIRPILVDTGAQKRSILVKLEAVSGPILVHFGPHGQPLWAQGRPIFANFWPFFGRQDARFQSNLERQLDPSWLTRERQLVNFDRIGGRRWAIFGSVWAAQSPTLGPRTVYFRQCWPFLGRQDARFRSNLER